MMRNGTERSEGIAFAFVGALACCTLRRPQCKIKASRDGGLQSKATFSNFSAICLAAAVKFQTSPHATQINEPSAPQSQSQRRKRP
jgi:hypothetical protein